MCEALFYPETWTVCQSFCSQICQVFLQRNHPTESADKFMNCSEFSESFASVNTREAIGGLYLLFVMSLITAGGGRELQEQEREKVSAVSYFKNTVNNDDRGVCMIVKSNKYLKCPESLIKDFNTGKIFDKDGAAWSSWH